MAEAPQDPSVSTGNRRLGELRRQESERRAEELRYRFTLVLAVAPVSAAMALAVLYVTVPATFAERYVYSEIARPPLGEFIRAAVVVPVVGALLGSALTYAATDLLGVPRSPTRLLFTFLLVGVFFGLFVPLATALVLPINLILVEVTTNFRSGNELVDDLLAAVFGTPGLLFIYWAQGLYIGVVSGFVVAAVSFSSIVATGRGAEPALNLRPAVLSLVIGSALMALLLAGPFGLYEGLIRQIAGR